MKKMIKAFAIALLLPVTAFAAGGGATYPHDGMSADHGNKSSLQRGARNFVNYCMGCHGASYMRYNRLAADLGIPEDLAVDNLIFRVNEKGEREKVGSLMRTSMTPDYGKQVFGVTPPDLSLIARSRGVDWLYNYLRGFHQDESRPLGFDNSVFKGVGMPHVLWELEGVKKAVYDEAGTHVVGFETVTEGKLSKMEYDSFVYDLVNFLDYLGEPYKADRQRVGVYILIFLFLFGIVAYALKAEYWRDVK